MQKGDIVMWTGGKEVRQILIQDFPRALEGILIQLVYINSVRYEGKIIDCSMSDYKGDDGEPISGKPKNIRPYSASNKMASSLLKLK
jgi:hypothetical protein